jgi:predicted nucleotidyltransferase
VYTGGNILEKLLHDTRPFHGKSFQNEWQFLCACASPTASQKALASACAAVCDWDLLLELAEEHGVLGLLSKRVAPAQHGSVPPAAREKLRTRMRAQQLFVLGLTADLFQILEEFDRNNIEAILVKGPVVSLLAYGDPATRNYADLDLLVRHRQILATTQCMQQLGYEADIPENAIEAGKIPGEYVFKRNGRPQLIELHTEPTFRYYPRPMRIEEMYSRRRRVKLDGREIPALSIEDELLLNCIHGGKHFWERLMWIADIALIGARNLEISWDKVFKAAEEVGAERMLCVGLQLTKELLGAKLPAEIQNRVTRDPEVQPLCAQIIGWLPMAGLAPPSLRERALFRMRMAGGGVAGAAYLSRLSLAPTEEDWVEGQEHKRSWVWDAVRRPFRLFRKYGQG